MAKPNILIARFRPESMGADNFTSGLIELFNQDGSPYAGGGGGGGGIAAYIDGHNIQKGVMGVNDYLYFDGTETGVEIVGIDNSEAGQSLELPAGVYISSWQWGFDTTADDGVGDTIRMFAVELQPIGKALESIVQKPAGGWADADPYLKALAWNFVLPNPANLIVRIDGTSSGETTVNYYLNFTVYRLGDIPEG